MISKTATEKKQMQQTETRCRNHIMRFIQMELFLASVGAKVDLGAAHHFLKSITHYMESQGVRRKQNSRRFRANFLKWCRALTIETAIVTVFDAMKTPFALSNFYKIIPHLCCTMRTCAKVYSYASEG
jgi:hypothetical protein